MEVMLYSDDLEIFTGNLSPSIEEAIIEIQRFLQISNVFILKYDEFNIAIPLSISVNLPSKGTHENIDIRDKEPILLLFSLKNYPTTSPRIKSDRKDFPTTILSHLYAVNKGVAPTLCLVRENLDEWFANRRISDLISVVKQWFSKAANGLLSEDADEFEPVRLEGYRGYSIYNYIKLYKLVNENKRYNPEFVDFPFAYQLLSTKEKDSKYPTFKRFEIEITPKNFDALYKIVAEFNIKTIEERKDANNIEFPLFGIILWSNLPHVVSSYSTLLPKTIGELETFANEYSISIREPISEYINNKLFVNNLTSYIPVIIALKRPKKLIGFEAEYEFFHFVINASPDAINEDNYFQPETEVFFQAHREPISSGLAQKLSLSKNQEKTVFIGAGALGSKLLFHYARSGNFNIKAIDNDKFSPHNIVRHDLFMESSGVNKAKAVIEKIKSFLDDNSSLDYFEGNIFNLDVSQLKDYQWLVDTSASLNVQNWLINSKLKEVPNRARVEIAYKGNLGFLYIEGENQNPRIDDLVNYVYFLGIRDKTISDWLNEENKKKEGNDYDIVDIGIGCNSPTVIMSNDSMSFHASIFSKILNHEHDRKDIGAKGLLNISYISNDGFKLYSNSFLISKFSIFVCCNKSGWEIRIVDIILSKMKQEADKYKRYETGGIFIGICNYKTKTIHVFDTILAPKDSKRSTVYFYRGIEKLPEQVKQIKDITGGMIGYIGEWHTHPMGLDSLSGVDLEAVEKLKPLNDRYPIPTFISVLSKENFLPFVF